MSRDAVWSDLAKLRHFGKNIWAFIQYMAQFFNLFGPIFVLLGRPIFVVINGPNWSKPLVIWSHCLLITFNWRPPHPKKFAGFESETSWIEEWKKRLEVAGDPWTAHWLTQQVHHPTSSSNSYLKTCNITMAWTILWLKTNYLSSLYPFNF